MITGVGLSPYLCTYSHYPTLKMEAACTPETLVMIYVTTYRQSSNLAQMVIVLVRGSNISLDTKYPNFFLSIIIPSFVAVFFALVTASAV
jgi:hypothetical protein